MLQTSSRTRMRPSPESQLVQAAFPLVMALGWACQDLNLGPHPYQLSRAKRCADRRFCRSLASVRRQVMRSQARAPRTANQARCHRPWSGRPRLQATPAFAADTAWVTRPYDDDRLRAASWPLRRPAMAPQAELGQRQRRTVWCLSVAARMACRFEAWLFGAVGPTQPHQAVLAKAGVAIQAPSSAEIAAVADACPVAPFQSAQRSNREGDRAGADANRKRVGSWLVGLGRAGLQRLIRCYGGGIEVGSEDLGDEDH
jgi:hypothetical protein